MKQTILFVDGDQNILRGIRRALLSPKHQWEMFFASSGQEALDLLQKNPVDLIITEMKMSGMNSIILLKHVMERYPKIIRMALSGYSKQEPFLQAFPFIHQYITKPFEPQDLKKIIERVFRLKNLFINPHLKKIITTVDKLPTLSTTYQKLQILLNAKETSFSQITAVISRDVMLIANILKLVNSSYFSLSHKIYEVEKAIPFLGFETLQAIIINRDIFNFIDINLIPFSMEQFNNHSLKVAKLAKEILLQQNPEDKLSAEKAFIAGMLHDIGKLFLAISGRRLTGDFKVEYDALKTSHGELGGYFLGLWGFDPDIVEAIAYHHSPRQPVTENQILLPALHIAEALVSAEEQGNNKEQWLDLYYIHQKNLFFKIQEWRTLYQKIKGA